VQREVRRYLVDVICWLDALDDERSVLRIKDTPFGRYALDLGGIVFKASAINGCAFFRLTGNQHDVYMTSEARAAGSFRIHWVWIRGGGDVVI